MMNSCVHDLVTKRGCAYQVSIKVEGPREVSTAEVLHRPAVYHKVVHPSILGEGGVQCGQVPRLVAIDGFHSIFY